MNGDLTTGVLSIRAEEPKHRREGGLQRHTNRLLAHFSSILSIKNAVDLRADSNAAWEQLGSTASRCCSLFIQTPWTDGNQIKAQFGFTSELKGKGGFSVSHIHGDMFWFQFGNETGKRQVQTSET